MNMTTNQVNDQSSCASLTFHFWFCLNSSNSEVTYVPLIISYSSLKCSVESFCRVIFRVMPVISVKM